MLKEKRVIESSSLTEYNGAVIESKALFKQERLIRIVHGSDLYLLRITKGNKLILTK